MIIAIDGPAGAGKSTIAKLLSRKLGFVYIDTGAMYRALTVLLLELSIDLHDVKKVSDIARNSSIDLRSSGDGILHVFVNQKEVTQAIREPAVTAVVSDVAKIPEVRQHMVELQRKLGESKNVVMDGRDIGTVVFPGAKYKFYLDADFDERVNRRYKELIASGKNITNEDVALDLRNRDTIDSTRSCGPLKKADDALFVDSSRMSINEVVEYISDRIQS